MEPELFETAACAASDLTARLLAELAQATSLLADAEARFLAARARADHGEPPIPFHVRRNRIECRRQVTLLHQVLAGMPAIEGECHAQSA